mmetsp:Transcript_51686/g.144428  ORF Transcript_51686/g.144428 Transcript_51686/m.144428 type:complete len:380 (-) Transcript_51686:203-1342(-)
MAPKLAKRPAANPVGRPPKKPAVDLTEKECELVAATVLEADLPVEVKTMLSKVAPRVLQVYTDIRHPHQASMVRMIGEVMISLTESLEASVAAARAKVDGLDGDKVSRDADVADADKELSGKTEAVKEKADALSAASVALDVAKEACKQAETAQKTGDAAQAAAFAKREALGAAESELAKFKEAAASIDDSKTFLAKLKKIDVDAGLLAALPGVLRKSPSERATFDALAMGQLDEIFAKSLAEVALAAGDEAAKGARAEAVEAARTAVSKGAGMKAVAADELDAAKVQQKEAAAAFKKAQTHAKSFLMDMKTAATCADAAEKALTAFKSGALAAFHELEVWALPAPGLAENPTDAPTGEAIQVAPAEEQSLAPAAALAA